MNDSNTQKEIERSKELAKQIKEELDKYVYPVQILAWPNDDKKIIEKS
jgi:hypothetical protein